MSNDETVSVTYIGPTDEISIPTGGGAYVTCLQGESVDVPREIAEGRKPRFADLPADAAPDAVPELLDAGTSGLLAQTDVWQRATPAKAPKPAPPPQPPATPAATTEETPK